MDKLVSLCKRRGFIFQSSEIYGGTGSVWDYGPLGVELKKNIKDRWWNAMVRARDDIEGLDAAILMHPRVWEASGHVAGFVDPLVDCKTCKGRFRADKLEDARCPQKPSKQPGQHDTCQLTEARQFNLMFKTFMGPLEESASIGVSASRNGAGHLRELPERAAVRRARRCRSASRRSARRSATRSRRATSSSARASSSRWRCSSSSSPAPTWSGSSTGRRRACSGTSSRPLRRIGSSSTSTAQGTRALRARGIRRQFDFGGTLGFQEIEGVHNRGDFDLTQHQQFSGKKLEYFDQPNNKRYVPYVIETSVGADRVTLAALVNAYREEAVEGEDEGRVVLGLHPSLAPIKAAVFPLTKKDGQPEMARSDRGRSAPGDSPWTTTRPVPSASAIADRTKSARRSASRWIRSPSATIP